MLLESGQSHSASPGQLRAYYYRMLDTVWNSILRGHLQSGRGLDEALSLMRGGGATIFECVASVREVLKCNILDAKRAVLRSPAWLDVADRTVAEIERELAADRKRRPE